MRVKLLRPGQGLSLVRLIVGAMVIGSAANAQNKTIRLRNETISTPLKANTALQTLAAEPATSGLFLIQFSDRLQPEWREQLRTMRVELLRYVPDDAFVARFDDVSPGQVGRLPFVRWVGPFRADYKIDPRLKVETSQVRVLLSPKASARDTAIARRSLKKLESASHSRFGAILHGEVTPAQLPALANSDAVLWIEAAPKMKLLDEISSKIVGGDDGVAGTKTATQQLGFDGSGVSVAVADSGLNNGDAATMHPDLSGRVDAFFFYGSLTDATDAHSHGTHVTGIIAGDAATGEKDENGFLYGLGVAPGAHVVAQRIFDGAGHYTLLDNDYERLTHDAVRAGAKIGSNSWGDDTQGRYDLSAAAFDGLVRDADAGTPGNQQYILEFSAGNAGPGSQTIGSPAVAKNVIATGAAENDRFDFFIYADGQDTMADFSSRGPCEDGRIKPDVVAPGTWIASLQSESATDENAWAAIDNLYQYQGGTSQAGPHASGAAAVFVQYYRETHTNTTPSPALVKAALINSAVDMDDSFGTDPTPNNDEGWGRLDLTRLIGSTRRYDFVDQTSLLTTGQTYERRVVVASSAVPFKITLAYTDVPGFPATIPALVNDLDLEVEAPDGRIYRGNQFDLGESVPDAPANDNINNVEAVHLAEPLPGEYIVRIRARNVVDDARVDTPVIDQDFALVASGDLPLPGVGVLFFDRSAYRAPDQIKLKLIDFDLAGQPSVTVRLASSTETSGESVTLFPFGPLGVFTNTVATATGAPAADGRLQIAHGNTIEATYQDASPAAARTATAVADLLPPVISNVVATNRFGRAVVSWNTDEDTTAVVRFGTNSTLSLAATNNVLQASHTVTLDNLVEGATYQFLVVSSDEAGNVTTNNNTGNLFSFVAALAKNVLLVNAYTPDDPTLGTVEIPVTAYTGPLDQTGVSYEVWNVSERGSPTANDLRPFRIVIWRYNDNPLSQDTISIPEQNALQTYVNGGGGLFISGMEILTRIGNVAFRTNVLQVQAFVEDAGVTSAAGEPNDVISSGMVLDLDYTVFDSDLLQLLGQSPDVSDTITISSNAVPVFLDAASGSIAGLRYPKTGRDSSGRVVFLSFPLDAVSESAPAPDNRANLLRNVIGFLAPGLNGLGTVALDSPAYTLPSRVTIAVGDSDLAGQGQTTVKVFSDTATNGVTATLTETPRRGLFRGFITLISAPVGPALAGQLPARNGDSIRAEYFDASANSIVHAAAVVDTVPPAITNVAVVPDYESAEISWETSEFTDALVQFGESPFLERTAFDSEPGDLHTVTLIGLRPDRTYYCQIVSRDAAGNATVDDNRGQLYTFRTLKPLTPPWTDNLDNSATSSNWTVFDGDGTQVSWQLGMPNNGWETSAHSPPNAWGSNLNGDTIDTAESFLISPAIDLTGGNVATLRFWHSYDFTDDNAHLERGELLLITNNAVATLASFTGDALGWTEKEIDLTPYVGRVIFLAWHFVYFTFEAAPRPGWLVDDVSVTTSIRGTLVVTNNLSQARFTVSGPVTQAAQGWSLALTNLPLGPYVVTFDPVQFYNTPAPQTNVLSSATPVVVQGIYTFADANSNGISDAWEQQFFGDVSPNRTQTTDTDGDGSTDYAEFVAGTDPNSAGSILDLPPPAPQSNASLRFAWPSLPGRAYRLVASADLMTWTPVTDWVRATSATTSLSMAAQTDAYRFYRLEVLP
jgi:hypothetical protein